MARSFSGRILFANKSPAQGVQVRIFDKDDPGKIDDDLTIEPGISDDQGYFNVIYEPQRYLDFKEIEIKVPRLMPADWFLAIRRLRMPDINDVYLPYLQFKYELNGRMRIHNVSLNPYIKEFKLPENMPVDFVPSIHGYKFDNSFPGYPLPFSVPDLPHIPNIPDSYGLCGGMSASAYDFILAGRDIPQNTEVPAQGSLLHKYLYRRQIDTFGPYGKYIIKFLEWMRFPNDTIHGTQKLSHDEFERIQLKLDDKNPVLLGLIYVKWNESKKIWNNHQVLAYKYSEPNSNEIIVNIYDPNFQERDDIIIHAKRVPVGSIIASSYSKMTIFGLKCMQKIGDQDYKEIHGFFEIPYVFVEPPENL